MRSRLLLVVASLSVYEAQFFALSARLRVPLLFDAESGMVSNSESFWIFNPVAAPQWEDCDKTRIRVDIFMVWAPHSVSEQVGDAVLVFLSVRILSSRVEAQVTAKAPQSEVVGGSCDVELCACTTRRL